MGRATARRRSEDEDGTLGGARRSGASLNQVPGMVALGKILGPSFKQEDMPDVMEKILSTYVALRQEEETFLACYQRVGMEPFKERVYAKAD